MIGKTRAIELLPDNSGALATAARIDLTAAIPTCPGWRMVDLFVHTGAVHRTQSAILRLRSQEPMEINKEMFETVPGLLPWLERSVLFGADVSPSLVPPGIVDWFCEGAAELCDALQHIAPSKPVWNWSDDHTARHYFRMLPIETVVHRWDAQSAIGRPEPVALDLAIAGIAHTFEVMAPFRRSITTATPGLGERFVPATTDCE